jgi:hypothetical protein
VRRYTLHDYNTVVKPSLIAPIKFTANVGVHVQFSQHRTDHPSSGNWLRPVSKPFLAFTAGVVVNVILGYILSVLVFGHYWTTVATH